jgi:hypothetical protein
VKPIRIVLPALLLVLVAALMAASPASASPSAAWVISAVGYPANLPPGGEGRLFVKATNVGGLATSGPTVIEVDLPEGLSPTKTNLSTGTGTCTISAPTREVKCEQDQPINTSKTINLIVTASVDASAPSPALIRVHVRSENAPEASAENLIPVQAGAAPFGLAAPLQAPLSAEDGSGSLLAGAHPYQQTSSIEFPTKKSGGLNVNSGHIRDIRLKLPPGLIGNPSASPVLCTEVQLEASKCPDESSVGTLDVSLAFTPIAALSTSTLYNMVPPPGGRLAG